MNGMRGLFIFVFFFGVVMHLLKCVMAWQVSGYGMPCVMHDAEGQSSV